MKNTHKTKTLTVVETTNPFADAPLVPQQTSVETLPIVSPLSNLNEFEHFKHFENIKMFVETNKNNFFKLTQIAKMLQCDAKTLRQKFRKIYAIFDQSKLPQIVASQNDNEKWLFEFNEKNLLNVLKMSYMQNIKIEMQMLKIA